MQPIIIDQPGTVIDTGGQSYNNGKPTEIIVTADDVTIRNTHLIGRVRTMGMGINGEAPEIAASSYRRGHTERVRAAAPKRLVVERCIIESVGDIPVYLGPGTTRALVTDTTLTGHSASVQMYMDCESGYNVIQHCVFEAKAKREAIAIDGSANNTIQHCTFKPSSRAVISLYRNSGEGGTRRHCKPRYNVIKGNTIYMKNQRFYTAAIWFGPRLGIRAYSFKDGLWWGNLDYADYNVVEGNIFHGRGRKVHDWGRGNRISY